jgi:hypothetical protein
VHPRIEVEGAAVAHHRVHVVPPVERATHVDVGGADHDHVAGLASLGEGVELHVVVAAAAAAAVDALDRVAPLDPDWHRTHIGGDGGGVGGVDLAVTVAIEPVRLVDLAVAVLVRAAEIPDQAVRLG